VSVGNTLSFEKYSRKFRIFCWTLKHEQQLSVVNTVGLNIHYTCHCQSTCCSKTAQLSLAAWPIMIFFPFQKIRAKWLDRISVVFWCTSCRPHLKIVGHITTLISLHLKLCRQIVTITSNFKNALIDSRMLNRFLIRIVYIICWSIMHKLKILFHPSRLKLHFLCFRHRHF
jgi:hypothetical protein